MNPLDPHLGFVADHIALEIKIRQQAYMDTNDTMAMESAAGGIQALTAVANRIGQGLQLSARQQFLERAGL